MVVINSYELYPKTNPCVRFKAQQLNTSYRGTYVLMVMIIKKKTYTFKTYYSRFTLVAYGWVSLTGSDIKLLASCH